MTGASDELLRQTLAQAERRCRELQGDQRHQEQLREAEMVRDLVTEILSKRGAS
jgi:hypothetical protein